jgi:protein N-terminal methyltransferase
LNSQIYLPLTTSKDFVPEPNTYDVIWIQWVVGHLHDVDFIDFFKRCLRGLNPHGFVILKDNCSDEWTYVVDKNDSSISRSIEYTKVLFDMAGCEVVHVAKQTGFPPQLSSVYMFALRPL